MSVTDTAPPAPMTNPGLIAPHGGALVDLLVPAQAQEALKAGATRVVECSDRNACDVELLVVGGFSPLRGFMHQDDYESVVQENRTRSGLLFGLPIVFDTDDDSITIGETLLLQYRGQDLAVLTVESVWEPDKVKEAQGCYGTTSIEHPAVRMISGERGRYYIGGRVQGLELPRRVFPCRTPAEVRATLPAGESVVAFQCRNPIHRAHYELFTRALDADNVSDGGVVLVHPTCGPTQDDDIPGEVRFQTYERLAAEVNNPRIRWAYLPYSMHMAGPREALQHMIIRKNYGCTHFIIGRDMAGCKSSLSGDDFYGPYQAQDFARDHAAELGMETVPSLNLVYTEEEGYVTAQHAEARGLHVKKLSGTQFRQMLRGGEEIPEWFAFRSVVDVLRAAI
ncbi:MAG: sulfate adenylyltransferase [Cyanobacteriota bacterium]|nr:sulfate adenylyltransferase [Cyanobacteriota bacterium]